MFERYTERARRVIFFARYEASAFGSTTIETEHMLLGLLREARNVVNRFAHITGSDQDIRHDIEGRLTVREKLSTAIDLPLSDECKRILAYATEEAERLHHRYIGTEHIFLGMLREEKCGAAEVLYRRGADLNVAREQLARSPMPDEPDPRFRGMFRQWLSQVISGGRSPVLPEAGVVPDAEGAKQIAKTVWTPMFGADTVRDQEPFTAERKFNVWIVTGSSTPETVLFAFILQEDGRILSMGKGVQK